MQQQLMCESPGVLIVCQPDISQENDTDSLKMQDTLGCIDRSIMPRLQSFAQQVSVECSCMLGIVLSAGERTVNKTDKPDPHAADIQGCNYPEFCANCL